MISCVCRKGWCKVCRVFLLIEVDPVLWSLYLSELTSGDLIGEPIAGFGTNYESRKLLA